ncbi:magnesium/cobalt transporter CorA [Arenimonas caeni]|jgi:magnesium transporter|uniref:Magnesium transport protein CorA n=1 Tax=Arenimonas caeni TaxID=2058085 RepID=A0A2P6M7R0_9GAMM|nr:magnesium/cobalt transporter CorA [Arenimonas caeni]MDY0022365.1 magnesium/cobalt transporter CorA [Arenimonas caeni]PRH82026.1 magnesium and cobalt transport protein CorA [Arenimonas caeni]
MKSPVVNCVRYGRDGGRSDISLDAISDVLAVDDGSFVWVGLYEPGEELLDKLQEEFGLHDLAVEDAHHAHQRPKIEAYGNSLFIAVHTAQAVDGGVNFGETHMFVGPRYLVTVRHGTSLSYDIVRARCEREPELLALGPAYGLYAVLDFIVDNYLPIVDEFRDQLNELEHDIFAEDFSRDTVRKLYDLKGELTRLRLAVTPMQDITGQLTRVHTHLVGEEMRLYFRDVYDHILRVSDATDTLREMLTAAMSVNLALVTVAQGEVVKRLAGWAALLAAPTLITSWYGMNFPHMPEFATRFGYAGVIGLTAVVVAGLFVLLRRARWL